MITSISSFTNIPIRPNLDRGRGLIGCLRRVSSVLLLLVTAAACGDRANDEKFFAGAKQPSANASVIAKPVQHNAVLLVKLQANFDVATQGDETARGVPKVKSRMIEMPSDNSAGIGCRPANLSRNVSKLNIELPRSQSERNGVFAVIVPDGSLRIIYEAYGDDIESIDLIIPSKTIDWESARDRSSFQVDVRKFNALLPVDVKPSPLFHDAGIYQFALMNFIQRDYPPADNTPFKVKAGCVIHWQP
jgi:hypothetical protein